MSVVETYYLTAIATKLIYILIIIICSTQSHPLKLSLKLKLYIGSFSRLYELHLSDHLTSKFSFIL